MDYFAGLDVSVKETSICIVDDAGKIVREVKVASEPEALLAVLKNPAYHFKRIGLEAGQARRLRTGPAFSASVVTPSRWRPSGGGQPSELLLPSGTSFTNANASITGGQFNPFVIGSETFTLNLSQVSRPIRQSRARRFPSGRDLTRLLPAFLPAFFSKLSPVPLSAPDFQDFSRLAAAFFPLSAPDFQDFSRLAAAFSRWCDGGVPDTRPHKPVFSAISATCVRLRANPSSLQLRGEYTKRRCS